jgi:hypothetical protein
VIAGSINEATARGVANEFVLAIRKFSRGFAYKGARLGHDDAINEIPLWSRGLAGRCPGPCNQQIDFEDPCRDGNSCTRGLKYSSIGFKLYQ